jgi:4-carboxymuconolactone decarboxylase
MGYQRTLRKLAVRDDQLVSSVLADDVACAAEAGIDARTRGLIRLGALIALDAAPPSYLSAVEEALAGGATLDEVVGALVTVMPVVGAARVVSAAPKLGLAVGYDVADALEQREEIITSS